MVTNNLYQHFQQRLVAASGQSYLLEDLQAAADMIVSHPALEAKDIVVPPDFNLRDPWGVMVSLLQERGIQVREAKSAADVADAPAGLSNAEAAVSETGSVLIAENSLEARMVSMLTLTHFVLVSQSDLVPMLDEVGVLLQQFSRPGSSQRRYVSLITGPSRTADIERTLTVGVQGPRALCVLIIR